MRLVTRETLLAFQRAPLLSFLSISSIAFSLFSFGLFALVAVNIRDAILRLEERVEIVAYLLPGTPVEAAMVALDDIRTFPEVTAVRYVSSEDALEHARAELPEFQVVFEEVGTNPLPASLEIDLREGAREAATVELVAGRLSDFAVIDDVRFGRDWIERIDEIRRVAGAVGLVVGTAFAIVAIMIIGSTIRMAILQRAEEISIMRLVGATDGFIRRPFLLDGSLKGVLGGLGALILCYVAFLVLQTLLPDAAFFSGEEGTLLVAFGLLLGFTGSMLSVGRHLRQV